LPLQNRHFLELAIFASIRPYAFQKLLGSRVNFNQRFLSWSVGLLLLTSLLTMAASFMVVDIDLFHEMALFRQMVSAGAMPLTDDFAYTPTLDRVVHHEWGTGAILYLVSITTGWGAGGIVALKYTLCFTIGVGCFVYCRRQGTSLLLFASLSFVALNLGGSLAFTNVRAQLFTVAFLVVLFFLIEADRRGNRWWIVAWIPICIVWSNMHAGVVSGIGILAIYGFSRLVDAFAETRSIAQSLLQTKHLILVGILSALAINVSPYGFDYVPYLIRAIRMERPLISEWLPIWKSGSPAIQVVFLISIFVAGYALLKQKPPMFELLALCVTAYLAMKHLRHVSLYAVTWICLVPPMIERLELGQKMKQWSQSYGQQIAVACLGISIVAIGCSIKMRFWELRIPTEPTAIGLPVFPVGAVNYLRDEQFSGNLFVPFQTGAFVSWSLYPQVKVSLDSRYEVAYPNGAVEENWKFYLAEAGWQETLKKYDTDAVLVPLDQAVLKEMDRLAASDPKFEWEPVFRDRGTAIFMRRGERKAKQFDETADRKSAIENSRTKKVF